MQIHNLPAQTTAADADVFAIDNGTTTQKITAANLGKKITEDAKPAFTSNDSATANSWTSVAVLASAETMKSILNKISTMFKNIRYLYNAVTQLNTDLITAETSLLPIIPAGSDFNSYNTPGTFRVVSDADAASMQNIPRNASGKLVVIQNSGVSYEMQMYFPSTSTTTIYVRTKSSTWGVWTTISTGNDLAALSNSIANTYATGSDLANAVATINNTINSKVTLLTLRNISESSSATIQELGFFGDNQYGASFTVLRSDITDDGGSCYICRRNAARYEISRLYEGAHSATPIIGNDGTLHLKGSGYPAQTVHVLLFQMVSWS